MPRGKVSYVPSGHAVRGMAVFLPIEVTLGHAVGAESGHSVGTRKQPDSTRKPLSGTGRLRPGRRVS